MIRLILLIAIIAGVGVGYVVHDALSQPYREAGYRWQAEDFPLSVDLSRLGGVGELRPDEVREAARGAMAAWNEETGRALFLEGSGRNYIAVAGTGSFLAETVMEPAADDSSRPGSFHILVSPKHGFSVVPRGEIGKYDLPTTLIHELGHVLGLGHPVPKSPFGALELFCLAPPWNGRVMCPRLEGQVMRSPGSDDLLGFWSIYEDLR